jgi:ribulose-5-phosphate 4-epimerase/fuculose-1-phosphate aldolase
MMIRFPLVAGMALLASWILLGQSAAPPKGAGPAGPASQDLRTELVLADQILSNQNVLDAYGHVSVRSDRNPNHYLMSRAVAAGSVTNRDIVEYDLDSQPTDGNTAALFIERFIHGEIYKARPDVMAIIHCHAPEVIPFGVTNVPLLPLSHMAGFLGEGVPVFEIRKAGGVTDMLIRTPALGKALAQTLADKPAALLRGHGAVVVATNLHIVVGRAYYMAMNARLQQQAIMLGGKVTYMEKEEAKKSAPQDGFERAWEFWKSKATVR